MWVAVGGSWRDEDNVCGYWRFSDLVSGAGGLVGVTLEDGKQVLKEAFVCVWGVVLLALSSSSYAFFW